MPHTLYFPIKTLLRLAPFQGTPGTLHYCNTSATWIPIKLMRLPPPSHVSLFASTLCLRERSRNLVF